MNIILKRNDKGYKFTYSLVDENGQVVNLTGTTVKFQMGDKSRIVIDSSATIEDAVNGTVSYTFTDADTLFNGNFIGEFLVTFSGSKELRYPRDNYIVITIQLNVDVEATNITVDAVAARQGEFTDKLNAIIANNSSLSEVIDARGTFITLNERLNDSDTKLTLKADKDYVDDELSERDTQIGLKANKNYVDETFIEGEQIDKDNWNRGYVVEVGSNANGSYIKFNDGTMICRTTIAKTVTYGGQQVFWWTPGYTWTFPVAFITNPEVTHNSPHFAGGAVGFAQAWATSATTASYIFNCGVNTSLSVDNFCLVATGKWK